MELQVKAESVILNGDPREMICQASEQMQVDLLIMGSRGLGTLKRLVFCETHCSCYIFYPFFLMYNRKLLVEIEVLTNLVLILVMGFSYIWCRAFLGSVSDYCAHHAKAPILIVKPPQEHHKKH